MAVKSFQGTIEKGQVRLAEGVLLPENTKVYVVVPDIEQSTSATKFDLAEIISRMPPNYQAHEEGVGDPIGKEEW